MYLEKEDKAFVDNHAKVQSGLGSFSGLFSDAEEPYMVSRSFGNAFCYSFAAVNNARADNTADAIKGKWAFAEIMSCKVCQDNDKALMSDPNKALGEWILRRVLRLNNGEICTKKHLDHIGIDSIGIDKHHDGSFSIDFAPSVSWESFKNQHKQVRLERKNDEVRFFFFENVKNLANHDGGKTFEVILKELKRLDYKVRYAVLNACEYGDVPQNRERTYIVAFRESGSFERFAMLERIPLRCCLRDLIGFDEAVSAKYYYTKGKCGFYDKLVEASVVVPVITGIAQNVSIALRGNCFDDK